MTRGTGTMYGNRESSRHKTALSFRGFDRRQKAKAEAANDGESGEGGDGPDMFSHAGVAAE